MNQIWGTSFLDKATKEEHEQLRGLTPSFLSKLSFFIINLPRIYFLVYNKELPCIQQDKPQQVWKKRLRRVFFFFFNPRGIVNENVLRTISSSFYSKDPWRKANNGLLCWNNSNTETPNYHTPMNTDTCSKANRVN